MAEKKKQHYVPKFYLRSFALDADDKRISLCVVDGLRVVAEAGLDGQCYENYFYGADGAVEDQLQKMETDAAAIIREVLRTGLPPASGSGDAVKLLCFVAAQAGRTKHAAAMMEAQTESFLKKIAVLSGRVTEEDLRGVRIEQQDPVLLPLITNIQSAVTATDLAMKLLDNQTDLPFITSDNPVVRYNQYWGDRRGVSQVGWACQGLQIFFPLSPRYGLMLYDSSIYKVGNRRDKTVAVTVENDVCQLNGLQWANSQEVVFFSAPALATRVVKEGSPYLKHGKVFRQDIEVLKSVERPTTHAMLYAQLPQIRTGLALRFVSVVKRKRKRPPTKNVFIPRGQETADLLEQFRQRRKAGHYRPLELNKFVDDIYSGRVRGG